ncbi:MAG: AAA family ATPase [Chloroflexi bacterium]|nr:AAA family ATPase [Chloroflexota bacterium]
MSTPLLAAKLYIPPPRPTAVDRARLIVQLNAGLHRKMTLISAPAGFGKTTLVSAWAAGCGRPAAWVSLDEGDADPARFLAYIVAALQTVHAGLGADVLEALQSPQPPPIESLLTLLLNAIAALPAPCVLVLDDYHSVDSQPVDEALAFLVDHLPPKLHLVIATREDPQLPLARLRARGQLTELRVADLRFTADEAAGFLTNVMGLSLSPEDIRALESRTEGWVAGLQLAALALQGAVTERGQDAARFIRSFSGSHHFVLDYLVEEVLNRQSAQDQTFLLRTSILDRLCGPLCDAVVGDLPGDGQARLERLERANLFLIPLDGERRWYRYHHLFAELLRVRSTKAQAAELPALHARASVWYEQQGEDADAIRHALASGDMDRSADLIERVWPQMDEMYQSNTWIRWVRALPDEVIQARPVLSLGYGWALLNMGDVDAAEAHLIDAEKWLDGRDPDELPADVVVVDEKLFRGLPGAIAGARAYRALTMGDTAAALIHAKRARELSARVDDPSYRQAVALTGVAYWANGDLEMADRALEEFRTTMLDAGVIHDAVGIAFILYDIRIALGRLTEALKSFDEALAIARQLGDPPPLSTQDIYRGLAALHIERGELDEAVTNLHTAETLVTVNTLNDWPYRLAVTQARMCEVTGDLDGALEHLEDAEHEYKPSPLPNVRPVAALKARVWTRQGKLTEAADWARTYGIAADMDITYLREFEALTLARLLIAQHRVDPRNGTLDTALELLDRVLCAAEDGARAGTAAECLMLRALATADHDGAAAALKPFRQALELAERAGFVQMFVDEGPPMVRLLTEADRHGITPTYTRRLLGAFDRGIAHTPPSAAQGLIEPLSDREMEVLELVAAGLSNAEIAERLFLALDTVKGHNRRIFGKLGVQRRTEAIARARELGLI